MARIRQIKPEFFKNEDVAGLDWKARMLFIGLWTIAAADGRLLDRPRRIAAELFPYDRMDDQIDMLLGMLAARELIIRYVTAGKPCIQIVNFTKHQKPHHKEPESGLPPPPNHEGCQDVGQNQGLSGLTGTEPESAEASQVSPDTSRSGSLDNGSLENGVKPPARLRDPWHGWRWFERFKLAWQVAHGRLAYGSSNEDSRATGDLEDQLNSLPLDDRLSAQDAAEQFFAKYFANPKAAPGHPWKWFVQRFNELRAPDGPVSSRAPPPRDVRFGQGRADDSKHTHTGDQQL